MIIQINSIIISVLFTCILFNENLQCADEVDKIVMSVSIVNVESKEKFNLFTSELTVKKNLLSKSIIFSSSEIGFSIVGNISMKVDLQDERKIRIQSFSSKVDFIKSNIELDSNIDHQIVKKGDIDLFLNSKYSNEISETILPYEFKYPISRAGDQVDTTFDVYEICVSISGLVKSKNN